MASIKGIVSLRSIKREPFRDIVYEWENEISSRENIPIISIEHSKWYDRTKNGQRSFLNRLMTRVHKDLGVIKKTDFSKDTYLFICTILDDAAYAEKLNCIPVFIDIWEDSIERVCRKSKKLDAYFVTSLDVYNMIRNTDSNSNVNYISLSVPDKYLQKTIPNKNIDIIQVGRKNGQLHEFATKYCEANKEVDYVYCDNGGTTGKLEYFSTKRGSIGSLKARDEYVELLKNAKIFIMSSPGANHNRNEIFIDLPTPRFYEAAIFYCHMVGIHSGHEEFETQGVNKVMRIADDYDTFKNILDDILLNDCQVDKETYDMFINQHLTSTKFNEIKKVVDKL